MFETDTGAAEGALGFSRQTGGVEIRRRHVDADLVDRQALALPEGDILGELRQHALGQRDRDMGIRRRFADRLRRDHLTVNRPHPPVRARTIAASEVGIVGELRCQAEPARKLRLRTPMFIYEYSTVTLSRFVALPRGNTNKDRKILKRLAFWRACSLPCSRLAA